MTHHLRIERARLYLGAVTCSCGEPGCTRYAEEARAVAASAGGRWLRRDLARMAARKRAGEGRAVGG